MWVQKLCHSTAQQRTVEQEIGEFLSSALVDRLYGVISMLIQNMILAVSYIYVYSLFTCNI